MLFQRNINLKKKQKYIDKNIPGLEKIKIKKLNDFCYNFLFHYNVSSFIFKTIRLITNQ